MSDVLPGGQLPSELDYRLQRREMAPATGRCSPPLPAD